MILVDGLNLFHDFQKKSFVVCLSHAHLYVVQTPDLPCRPSVRFVAMILFRL
jgi:hypothetical protein